MNKSLENKNETLSFNPWELYSGAPRSTEKTPPAPRKTEPKIVRNSGIVPVPESESSPVRGRESSPAPERKRASSSQIANGFDPFDDSMFRYRKKSAKVAAPTRETSAKTERKKQTTPNEAEAAAKQEKQTRSFAVSAVTNAVIKQRAPEAKTAQASAPAREISSAKTQKLAPIPANKKPESMPAEKTAERESEPAKHPTISRTKNSAPKSEAKNQKNTDPAKKFGDPLTPGLPPLTEKEKKAKKRNFLRKVIASLVLFSSLTAGAAMANSAWHDIHSGGAETSRFAAGRNSDFKGNSTNKKDAPAVPELKQWPNIPSTDLNKLATGQQAGAIKMPNGHIVKMVIGNKNQSSNDTNLMSPDTAAVANLGDMSALGQPGVNVGQDHSGYLDENVAFNQLASGESMLGKKFEVTANDGTRYVYEITQRVVVAPEYQGHGTTVIQTNSDGTPRLADTNDPNSVIPIEGAKFFNGETGKFYADPLHPSDKEADNNKSILALSTCAEDEMSKAYHHGLSTHGLRIVSYGALEAVYDKAGNLIAGDGENAITGHTPAQLENIQALDAAAKIANGATNQ